MTAIDEKIDTLEQEAEEARERRLRIIVRAVAAAMVLAVIVAIGLPVFSMLQPAYWESHPELKSRIDGWHESTHARIPCADCHVNPGVRGFIDFSAASIPAFYSQLLNGPNEDNILTIPDRWACQKCHTSYRQVSSSGDLLIPHRAHVEVLEMECAVCHRDLVHSVNERGFNSPEMETCLNTCHDGEQASKECVSCHTRKEVPDNHRADDWLQTHSAMTSKIDCGTCHAWSPDYCAECHSKRPASHVGNWRKGHAPLANERGEKGCLVCHDDSFCEDCHD